MDEVDQAQLISDKYLAVELARVRAGSVCADVIHLFCIDCERKIPKKRRQAVPGCERCVKCQEIFELRFSKCEVKEAVF